MKPLMHFLSNLNLLIATVLLPDALTNALKISLVVGSALNAINQGRAILTGNVEWGHLLLNYLVPFCVAAYSGRRSLQKYRNDNVTGEQPCPTV